MELCYWWEYGDKKTRINFIYSCFLITIFPTQLIVNYPVILSYQCRTTVSLETYPLYLFSILGKDLNSVLLWDKSTWASVQSMISSNPGFIVMVTYRFCMHLSQYWCLTTLEQPDPAWPSEWDLNPKPLDCEPYILTTHPHHAASSFTKFPSLHLNPFTPKSNRHLNSPHHITPESNINVRRI